jgi:glutamate racemase
MQRIGAIAILTLFLAIAVVARSPDDPVFARAIEHQRTHPEGDAAATFVMSDYAGDLRSLPIGVFDSGVGGLTVLEALKTFDANDNASGKPGSDGVPDFANERFVYFGDQANMPYGNYGAAGKTDFLRELILKDAAFLLGRRWRMAAGEQPRMDKPPVKAIVIACNTATAYGLEDVRAAARAWGVSVLTVGVVEAGARGLADTRGGRTGAVAVFATKATCASNAYPRAIAKAMPAPPQIVQRGSATLAASIEGDPAVRETPRTIIDAEVEALVAEHARSEDRAPIDTVVLGCTHYPLVQSDIVQAFERMRQRQSADGTRPFGKLVSEHVAVIDPAQWTAEELWRTLQAANLLLDSDTKARKTGDLFFISVANPAWPGVQLDADGGLTKDFKYGREPGNPGREDTVIVPMTIGGLPASAANLVKTRLPKTAESMRSAEALSTPSP